jgi:ATP-GRASP peptide maturase of grasp-with-spasm system
MDQDHSTDEVIDWLDFYNIRFDRINLFGDLEDGEFNISLVNKAEKKKQMPAKGWIRKFGFFNRLRSFEFITGSGYSISNYLIGESRVLRQAVIQQAGMRVEWLCPPESLKHSKYEILQVAIDCNLDVPETFVTNNKKRLKEIFYEFAGKVIVKSLSDNQIFSLSGFSFAPLTYKLCEDDFERIPDFFFSSLIQEQIEKEFEIRTFYLNGKFYSAAIFSQADVQTQVDFRNYNYSRPNRLVPFCLPVEIEAKLKEMSRRLSINTGSFDLIKGINGKYYFLEVNQAGQFGMISKPCNFFIEKDIAYQLK